MTDIGNHLPLVPRSRAIRPSNGKRQIATATMIARRGIMFPADRKAKGSRIKPKMPENVAARTRRLPNIAILSLGSIKAPKKSSTRRNNSPSNAVSVHITQATMIALERGDGGSGGFFGCDIFLGDRQKKRERPRGLSRPKIKVGVDAF